MNSIIEQKRTRLETSDIKSVKETLNWKIEEAKEKNLPIESHLADYIAFGIQNLDDRVEQLKNYKKMIDEEIKSIQEHKKDISSECFEYIKEELGVDKLQGVIVSSITCKAKDISIRKKFIKDVEDSVLVENGFGHYEDVISEIPQTIKINKKRAV